MKRAGLFLVIILSLCVLASAQARKGNFEIVKTEQGKYYYVLKASNGQQILKGYQFGTEGKARDAIVRVRQQAVDDANFDQRHENEQFYFFLKDAEGKAIGRSENYTTEAAMKRGIESVKKTAPEAAVNSTSN